MDGDRQRLDRWLWHARVVKTRELAKALIESGHVRVDRVRDTKPGSAVRRGQTLTVTLPSRILVLKIVDFVERRGSAEVAARLYEDLSPPRPLRTDPGPPPHHDRHHDRSRRHGHPPEPDDDT